MFSGGSAEPAAAQQQPAGAVDAYASPSVSSAQQENWGANCQTATQHFTRCMDENGGNMQICNWYLEQLVRFFPCSRGFCFPMPQRPTDTTPESLPGRGVAVLDRPAHPRPTDASANR